MTLKLLKENKKEDWILQTPYYNISSADFKIYSKLWRDILSNSLYKNDASYRTLLINDGIQLIYNSLSNPSEATIVDELAYAYTEESVSKVVNTVPFKSTSDSLGRKRTLTLIDETFKDAYEDCLYKNKYDLIFLNVQQPSDLTVDTVEKVFTLLDDFGCFFIQLPSTIAEQDISKAEKALEHYFSYLSYRVRSSSENVSQSFIVYRKIKGLI